MPKQTNRQPRGPASVRALWKDRSGVAAIEFALSLPVLILLLAGSINFGHVIYVQHSMQSIASETLRTVIYGTSNNDDAKQFALDQLADLHGKFEVNVADVGTDKVKVSITANAKASTLMPFPFVSADMLSDEFEVNVLAPRITPFNPANT